jgi:hypothetical protein
MGGEGPGWVSWLGLSLIAVLVVAAVGLTIYGGHVTPDSHHYEQAVPDDHLPH